MKALQVSAWNRAPEITDLPMPVPAAQEIVLDIHACGLNFADLLMIAGTYQDTPALPFVPGMEVAGRVARVGDGVDPGLVGQRVAVFGGHGGLAESGCFPVDRAVPLPDGMGFVEAAAFQVAYGTSHVALDHKARLQPDETLLVLGAAGGVGLTAIEIGKLMGARVIACARGADKLAVARQAGADHLVDAEDQDLRAVCRDLGGVDVVFDPVGGDQFRAAMRACRPEGRILTIGYASGEVPQIPANHLLVKNLSVLGLYWGGYMAFRPQVVTGSLQQLFAWYREGRLHPHVSHVLPLGQANAALDLLRQRKSTGKVVVTPRIS